MLIAYIWYSLSFSITTWKDLPALEPARLSAAAMPWLGTVGCKVQVATPFKDMLFKLALVIDTPTNHNNYMKHLNHCPWSSCLAGTTEIFLGWTWFFQKEKSCQLTSNIHKILNRGTLEHSKVDCVPLGIHLGLGFSQCSAEHTRRSPYHSTSFCAAQSILALACVLSLTFLSHIAAVDTTG